MTHRILPSGTIYTTISNSALRSRVEETIKSLQPNFVFKHFCSDEQKQETTGSINCGLKLLKHWQQHKGDVAEEPVTFSYSCYITDLNQDNENDGTVVYALFQQGIPVIRFMKKTNNDSEFEFTNHLLQNITTTNTTSDRDGEVDDGQVAAIASYFAFPTAPGRVIVIEGGDGSGKQTQTGLLIAKLRSIGKKVATIDFPHDAARYGVLIREGLAGHKGPLKDISPLVFASLYGLNRHDTKPYIDHWLLHGFVVVFDRWTTANYGHQASKFKTDEERAYAIDALRTFEVRWLGLPDADRVLYLDLPPLVAYEAMLADQTRKALDLHEKAGIEYKENVRRAFLWCCTFFKDSWLHVPCYDEKEQKRIARDDVHNAIWESCKVLF